MLEEQEVTLVFREAAAVISPAASKQAPTMQTRETQISPFVPEHWSVFAEQCDG